MPGRDIIVVGASAGGIETLRELVKALPADLPAAIFVAMHLAAGATSVLPELLRRAGKLPAAHAVHGQPIEQGRIYVAPPDHHLLLHRGHVRLGRGPRENRCRPAVDPLFRTAAHHFYTRVIGVVLSGNLDDGTAGLAAIKLRGGVAVVQDPGDALYPGMPSSAIANVEVDHIVPVAQMGALLSRLSREGAPQSPPPREMIEIESDVAELNVEAETTQEIGVPSGFACPECGGTLYDLKEGQLQRFRCRVGHAYSSDSLVLEQVEAIEAALYSALRALEESVALARRLAERARGRDDAFAVGRFERRAAEAEGHAQRIKEILRRSRMTAGTETGGFEAEATHAVPQVRRTNAARETVTKGGGVKE